MSKTEMDAADQRIDNFERDLAGTRTAYALAQASVPALVTRAQAAERREDRTKEVMAALESWLDMQSVENSNRLYVAARRYFGRPWVDPDEE